jgi:hypothetical protein
MGKSDAETEGRTIEDGKVSTWWKSGSKQNAD